MKMKRVLKTAQPAMDQNFLSVATLHYLEKTSQHTCDADVNPIHDPERLYPSEIGERSNPPETDPERLYPSEIKESGRTRHTFDTRADVAAYVSHFPCVGGVAQWYREQVHDAEEPHHLPEKGCLDLRSRQSISPRAVARDSIVHSCISGKVGLQSNHASVCAGDL